MHQSSQKESKIKNIKTLGIIILVIISFFAGSFFHRKKHNNEIAQYPYIDFSRNFLEQKDYITNIQPLREKLNQLADDFGKDKVSIYFEYLNTGANIAINPEHYIFPASLLKVPVGMVALKKVENGDWKLHNELVLLEGDKDSRAGDEKGLLADKVIGTTFTIEELVSALLVHSDNTAYNILARNLSNDDVKSLVDAIGLDKLADDEGKISAKEYTRILRSLYTASFLKREYSQMILELLDDSVFNEFITQPVDPSIPFSHKYGRNILSNTYSDSGIVYVPNRPYMLSVMVQLSKNDKEEVAQEFMQSISKEVYDYVSQYKQ